MTRQLIMFILVLAGGCNTAVVDSNKAGPASSSRPKRRADTPKKRNLVKPFEDEDGYVTFPSFGVRLRRPDGFDFSPVDGLTKEKPEASIKPFLVPASFAKFTAQYEGTGESIDPRPFMLLTIEEVVVDGHKCLLVSIAQNYLSTRYLRWILGTGDQVTTTVTASVAADMESPELLKLFADMKEFVLATKWIPYSDPELGFTIRPVADLKRFEPMRTHHMFTRNAEPVVQAPEVPYFVAAPLKDSDSIDNKSEFAQDQMRRTHIQFESVKSMAEVTIDGLSGYESFAEGKDKLFGNESIVYQVILFKSDSSYYLMHGFAGKQFGDAYLPHFKTMARSFTKGRE